MFIILLNTYRYNKEIISLSVLFSINYNRICHFIVINTKNFNTFIGRLIRSSFIKSYIMKFFFTILVFIVFLIAPVVHSQELDETKESKNEIGIVITDLIDGALQLKYERLLGEHFSVSLGLAYKGDNGLINLSGLDREQIKTGDITYSGLKIIPELRYYLNKTGRYGMDGFYVGAYLKYSNFQSDLNGTYISDSGENFVIEFDADIKVTSIGLMVGYKLPVSKRFALDFLIAGPGSGSYKFSYVNKKDLPDEFYEDFNQALENYSVFDLLDGDFRFADSNRRTKFNLFSFRYGISLGYSF